MNEFVCGFVLAIGLVALTKGSFMLGEIHGAEKQKRIYKERTKSNQDSKK